MFAAVSCGRRAPACRLALLLVPFAPALVPAPARAGAEDAAGERPVIVVTGRLSPSLTVDSSEDAARAVDRLPGGASVVALDDAEGRRRATLADALRLAPGVFAAPRFGPEDLRLSVRGSGLVRTGHAKGLLLLRDGVPVNAADGNFDPPTLDLASGAFLTILRGPAALGVGATTLGGAILLESRTGRLDPGGGIDGEGGSFGSWRGGAFAGAAGRNLDGFFAFSSSATDGWREQSATSATRVSGNLGVRLAPALETRVFAGHVDFRSKWPGVLTFAEYEANPRQASLVARRRDQDNDIRQSHVASRTVWAPGDHRVTFALAHDDRFKDHATPQGILEETNRTTSASLGWALGADSGPEPFAANLGLRFAATEQEARTFAYAGGLMSPLSAVKGALSSSRDRLARNLEAFGRAEWAFAPGLVATASFAAVRTSRRDEPGPGDPPAGGPAYDQRFSAFLPGAGLLWRPAAGVTLFAGWARSFEAPAFFDLGGNIPLQPDRIPRLEAQRAGTFEIGSRGRAGAFGWDVTLYRSRIEGELLRLDAAGALNPPIVNAGVTRRHGLEAAATADLAALLGLPPATLDLAAKWDWLSARFVDDPVYRRNRVAGLPEHAAYVELAVRPVEGLELRPNVTLRSRTETDLFNTPGAAADGFVLLGASARLQRGRVVLWVDGRNLGNRTHVSAVNLVNRATPSSALVFPGDPRAVYGGASLRF